MPTVPTLNPYGVKEEAGPNVSLRAVAPIEAFGGRDKDSKGNVFGAAEDLANVTSKLAVEAKKDADDTMIEKWKSHLTDFGNESLWNPEKGAYAQKGEKALNLKESYGGELDKEINRIYEKELHNSDQRQRFSAFADSYKSQYSGQLDKHSFGEYQEVQKNTMTASIASSEKDAVLNYMEPGRVDQSLMKQEQTWRDYAAKQGMSPEMTEEGLVKIQSSTHKNVLTRMLDNNQDLTAQAYFKRTKKSMTADDLVHVEKVLEEGSTLGEAQRKSLKIFTTTESKADAIAEVDKISNPKVQQKTRELLNQRYQDQATAKKEDSERLFAQGYKIIEDTKDYNQIPASLLAGLTPEHNEKLKEYAKKGPVNDWNEYYYLKTFASSNPKDFAQIDLLNYRNVLEDAEWKEMTNLQKDIREKKGGADITLAGFRTTSGIVDGTLREMGHNPTPKVGSEEATKVNLFRRMVDNQIMLRQAQTGKKITTEEVQGIVDGLSTNVITDPGWLWDTKKRAFELGGNESFQLNVDSVPKSERVKIETAWKRKYPNTPITDAQIVNLYGARLKELNGTQ